MKTISSPEELKAAMKASELELKVTDPGLVRKVVAWSIVRRVTSILVFVILALAIFAWANPFDFGFLATPGARLGRQIVLGVGILLLFADYLMPVVRAYNVKGRDEDGLILVSRRKR